MGAKLSLPSKKSFGSNFLIYLSQAGVFNYVEINVHCETNILFTCHKLDLVVNLYLDCLC